MDCLQERIRPLTKPKTTNKNSPPIAQWQSRWLLTIGSLVPVEIHSIQSGYLKDALDDGEGDAVVLQLL